MLDFFSPPSPFSSSIFFSLTAQDCLYIEQFEAANDKEKCDIVKRTSMGVIARISHNNSSFKLFCNRADLGNYWAELWCSYGLTLSKQQLLEPIIFYSQPKSNAFDLVMGAHLFHFSQRTKEYLKKDFMYSEMELLKIAIEYGSIHAIQRMNKFLYYKLESTIDKESIYNELIQNSLRMLPKCGAYGYMVLAEALSYYALWLLACNQSEKARVFCEKAFNSLDNASATLEYSKYIIHNASLGQGLKSSNSQGISTPAEAKQLLKEKIEPVAGPIDKIVKP